jgi:hypothetical protein
LSVILERILIMDSIAGASSPLEGGSEVRAAGGRPVIRDLMTYVDLVDTDGEITPNGLTSTAFDNSAQDRTL